MPDINNSQNETHYQTIYRYPSQKFDINWETVTISDINLIEDINEQDENAWTPLLAAALNNNNPEIITALINNGADINARLETDFTPLHLAAWNNNNPEIIAILIKSDADVNARDNHGTTPLHWGALSSSAYNIKIISDLANAGANVNARDKDGLTPLHWGAMNKVPDSFKTISALVNIGADVNARDNNGVTPLHWAALLSNNPKTIETLLKAGSNPKAKAKGSGETAYDFIKENEKLKDTSAYWKLHDLSFD